MRKKANMATTHVAAGIIFAVSIAATVSASPASAEVARVVGYVRNLPDGSVESVAEGPAHSVEAFKHDLATGPRFSTVGQIEEINLEPTGEYSSFRIEG